MPNRIIKESICTSEQIELLTSEEEVFFYRLMVVCDDFGLMDARLPILKAKCYPLKSIDIKKIQLFLNMLSNVGLVQLYTVEGKPFVHLSGWEKHQQIRAKKAKYPTPDEADQASDGNGNQLQSNAPVIQSNPIRIQSISNSNELLVPSPSAGDSSKRVDDCPHQEIIELYHEMLPECPRIKTWHNGRATNLRQRWREESKRQNLDWWKRYFAYVGKSTFLTGKAPGRNGGPPFVADLEWLTKRGNLAKVIEGKYHQEAGE